MPGFTPAATRALPSGVALVSRCSHQGHGLREVPRERRGRGFEGVTVNSRPRRHMTPSPSPCFAGQRSLSEAPGLAQPADGPQDLRFPHALLAQRQLHVPAGDASQSPFPPPRGGDGDVSLQIPKRYRSSCCRGSPGESWSDGGHWGSPAVLEAVSAGKGYELHVSAEAVGPDILATKQ